MSTNARPARQGNTAGPSGEERQQAAAGLCASCLHAEIVTSSRGSRFYLCRLSFTDPRFARYPTLPVLACSGYVESDPR